MKDTLEQLKSEFSADIETLEKQLAEARSQVARGEQQILLHRGAVLGLERALQRIPTEEAKDKPE